MVHMHDPPKLTLAAEHAETMQVRPAESVSSLWDFLSVPFEQESAPAEGGADSNPSRDLCRWYILQRIALHFLSYTM